MAVELHMCTCGFGGSAEEGMDGCAAVAYRDFCRFEQALVDPNDAQVDAALAEMAQHTRLPYGGMNAVVLAPEEEALVGNRDMMRRVLAAAAAVVTGRPPCAGCGRPLGTGTMVDFAPQPPNLEGSTVIGKERVIFSPMPVEQWRVFATRYRCPACAEASP